MRMRASKFLWSKQAVGAVLALFGAAVPAYAAQSLEPAARVGTYYEQNAFHFCQNSNACDLVFSRVPAGKTLTIQRISCSVRTGPEPLQSLTLGVLQSDQNFFERVHPLDASLLSTKGTAFHYTSATETSFPVSATPRIRAFTTTPASASEITVTCQIAGRLSP